MEYPVFKSNEKPIIHPFYKRYPIDKLLAETKMVIIYGHCTEFRKNLKKRGVKIISSDIVRDEIQQYNYFSSKNMLDSFKTTKYFLPDDIWGEVIDWFKYERKDVLFCAEYCEHFEYCDRSQCDMLRDRGVKYAY